MLITSKGRYALRLMIYIATFGGNGEAENPVTASGAPAAKVSLREVAESEKISLKYLEQLVRPLMAAGLLKSVRGKGGGYMLAKPARTILAGDVLRAAEGEKVAIACDGLEGACGRSDLCSTVKFWTGLEQVIDAYVDSTTLEELARIPEIKLDIRL